MGKQVMFDSTDWQPHNDEIKMYSLHKPGLGSCISCSKLQFVLETQYEEITSTALKIQPKNMNCV